MIVTKFKGVLNNNNLPILLLETGEIIDNYYLGRYLNAVYENGGTLSSSERDAVEDFFNTEDIDFSNFIQAYAFIGDTNAACVPLVDNVHDYTPLSLMKNAVSLDVMFHKNGNNVIDGATGNASDTLLSTLTPKDIMDYVDDKRFGWGGALGGTYNAAEGVFGVNYNSGSSLFGWRIVSGTDYTIRNYTSESSMNGSKATDNSSFVYITTRNVVGNSLGIHTYTISTSESSSTTGGDRENIDINDNIKDLPFAIGALNNGGNDFDQPLSMYLKGMTVCKQGRTGIGAFVKLLHDLGRDN